MKKTERTFTFEQGSLIYSLSLENERGNSIGIDEVVAQYVPREGEELSFDVTEIIGVGDYDLRGWTQKTISPYRGIYVVQTVRHKVYREGDRLISKVRVHAKLTKPRPIFEPRGDTS